MPIAQPRLTLASSFGHKGSAAVQRFPLRLVLPGGTEILPAAGPAKFCQLLGNVVGVVNDLQKSVQFGRRLASDFQLLVRLILTARVDITPYDPQLFVGQA